VVLRLWIDAEEALEKRVVLLRCRSRKRGGERWRVRADRRARAWLVSMAATAVACRVRERRRRLAERRGGYSMRARGWGHFIGRGGKAQVDELRVGI
jgi:hypothetical protein